MEVAGVALGAVGLLALVDLGVKSGTLLVRVCRAYAHADEQLDEIATSFENSWSRSSLQLRFLGEIEQDLDDNFRNTQCRVLIVLVQKISLVTNKLNSLVRHDESTSGLQEILQRTTRFRFAFIKKYLTEAVAELDLWQSKFDPTWYLILRMHKASIDEHLRSVTSHSGAVLQHAKEIRDALKTKPGTRRHINLPVRNDLELVNSSQSKHAGSRFVRGSSGQKKFIIDRITYDENVDVKVLNQDIRALASRLNCLDAPSSIRFGLLHCRGYMWQNSEDQKVVDLVFRAPTPLTVDPRSLRELLVSGTASPLSERLRLAQQIARAVCYVHNLDFVHKGVRPENIVHFQVDDDTIAEAFLLGFQGFRSVDGNTIRQGDVAWEKNVYRHPTRQGMHPEKDYQMQHDIYSLGICLLEVGLWSSLVVYSDDNEPELGSRWQAWVGDEPHTSPWSWKVKLSEIAARELPLHIGDRYRDVVINCLTCLDDDNADFADLKNCQDTDGVSIGVRYTDMILSELYDIRL